MRPRIERHEVAPDALAKATEGFHDRIAGDVHMQQHSGRNGFGWEEIADDLHAYAGARSVTAPHAEADIKAALHSAAEARLGALLLECAPSDVDLSVFVSYTGTGFSYGPLTEEDDFGQAPHGERPAPASDWRETMYLAIVTGQLDSYEGPLISLASHFENDRVLERALTHYVYPQLGAERDELEGHVADALEPFFASLGEDVQEHPDLDSVDPDLLFLHPLLARNEEAFWFAVQAHLEWHSSERSQESRWHPLRTLLPTTALAFAALAVRVEGWQMPFDSDYLPGFLVEDPAAPEGQRVGAYGESKSPEAVRALEEGPLVVERPETEFENTVRPGLSVEEQYGLDDKTLAELPDEPDLPPALLSSYAGDELMAFRFHSLVDPQARHPRQLAALTHASQYTAAKFARATTTDASVEVAIGENTVPMTATVRDTHVSETDLLIAVEYALLSGSRERLEFLLDLPAGLFRRPDERGKDLAHCYRRAVLGHLRVERARGWTGSAAGAADVSAVAGADVDPAVRHDLGLALAELDNPDAPPRMPTSPVLFSQLVAGDEDGFNLALADRLAKHRETYSAGHWAQNSDGLINRHVLALACLARAKGWAIRVESDYLPDGVLERAATMFR
ncbi:immunity 49 family protein [Nocardiopsis sp. HNM0947]|uniref:Immunity 49 family protein n=1 Tax=Nocardiopsis coralli TaxID=2772213 RepID=A0ABR9P8K0_9ACTN|nr:immunity 49 family protein [Nocardiopsis coralli]